MNSTLKNIHLELDPFYGKREVDAIARIIFEYLKGWSQVDMVVNADCKLSDFMKSQIHGIVERLKRYEPIQYIVGYAYFYGLKIKVRSGVLIPRPETAQLVDIIVDENKSPDLKVLDVCSGSGCISLALSRNLPFADVSGVDVSPDALAVARENASDLRCDVEFVQADIFRWTPPEKYDIIVSNPPYIDMSEKAAMDRNVTEYEPMIALFVPDADPLMFYERIAEIGVESLKHRGKIYFEINFRHSAEVVLMLERKGYSSVRLEKDMYGKDRFAVAVFEK